MAFGSGVYDATNPSFPLCFALDLLLYVYFASRSLHFLVPYLYTMIDHTDSLLSYIFSFIVCSFALSNDQNLGVIQVTIY